MTLVSLLRIKAVQRLLVAVAVFSALMALATASLVSLAQEEAQEARVEPGVIIGKAIGAGLAVGLAGVGGGYAVAVAGAAAISAVTEKRELFGLSFLIVVLGEGIAIYGLLVALIILFVI